MLACTKADVAENTEAAEISNDDHAEKTQDTPADAVENAETAETNNGNEIRCNSAISTCEKDQQYSETYRTAERHYVRSSGLKPSGAEAVHLKPKDMNGVLTATNTIEHAKEKKTG